MGGVLTTPAAVLLQLQAFTRVALTLGCHVVAPLALLASKRQRRSLI
jgi:hypothetical protein